MPANLLPFSTLTELTPATQVNSWVKIFDVANFPAIVTQPLGYVVTINQLSLIVKIPSKTIFDWVPEDASLDAAVINQQYNDAYLAADRLGIEIGQQFTQGIRSRYHYDAVNQGLQINIDLVPELSTFSSWQLPVNQPLYVRITNSMGVGDTVEVLIEGEIREVVNSQLIINLTSSGSSATATFGNQTLIIE